MDSNLKWKNASRGTDKYIGGIYYYVPNEKRRYYFNYPSKHLGVTNKMNIKIIIKRLLDLSRQPFIYIFNIFSYTL